MNVCEELKYQALNSDPIWGNVSEVAITLITTAVNELVEKWETSTPSITQTHRDYYLGLKDCAEMLRDKFGVKPDGEGG